MNEEPSNQNLSEPREPGTGTAQVPMAVMIVLIIFGYIGCNKVDTSNADFSAKVHAPFTDPIEVASLAPSAKELMLTRGKGLYANCNGCHGPNGMGTAGKIPPLAGSEWVLGDADTVAAIVLNGLGGSIQVAGKSYGNEAMTPFGPTLSDGDIAAVISYVRNEWGNAAEVISAEEVAKVRARIQDSGFSGNWNQDSPTDSLQAHDFKLPQ